MTASHHPLAPFPKDQEVRSTKRLDLHDLLSLILASATALGKPAPRQRGPDIKMYGFVHGLSWLSLGVIGLDADIS